MTTTSDPATGNGTDRVSDRIALGVVVRRTPGVTRWQREVWKPVAVIPGAGPADWKLLHERDGIAEFHAATVTLTLWRGEAEAYRIALTEAVPSLYVVLRPATDGTFPWRVHLVTANPHEAALFSESGDEIVEKVAMPPEVLSFVAQWTAAHYVEEPFVKRKRRKHRDDRPEGGIGDPRISQDTDVYRAPTARRHGGSA
ncbi:DUF3305 domain-containing protein [Litorisediminicola beolgyonensis]|uniref:DUF3305 domain-containing protein n=1 Tax=Litorisediminicola beolgyonensis TaxID=1173614 RepID=A0ABW3ZJG9_9RHOB